MTTLVRTDNVSGYKWVDFYVDQGSRWVESVTWWPGLDGVGSPVDLTGYSARLVVIRTGFEPTPVLDLGSPTELVLGGSLGTITWDVHADDMQLLTHPVYQHELTLFPGHDEDLAIAKLKGRVIVRATAFAVTSPPVVPGFGYGSGPYGSGPYGGSA